MSSSTCCVQDRSLWDVAASFQTAAGGCCNFALGGSVNTKAQTSHAGLHASGLIIMKSSHLCSRDDDSIIIKWINILQYFASFIRFTCAIDWFNLMQEPRNCRLSEHLQRKQQKTLRFSWVEFRHVQNIKQNLNHIILRLILLLNTQVLWMSNLLENSWHNKMSSVSQQQLGIWVKMDNLKWQLKLCDC